MRRTVHMKRTTEKEAEAKKVELLENVLKGQAMENYIEHRTSEMRHCALCDSIGYKRRPMKQVGQKWVCINCWRQIRETIDTLDRWEEEIALKEEMERTIKKGLGLQGQARKD